MKSKINTYLPAVSPSLSPWIIVILSLCFVNSYNGDFVFDDTEAIVNNVDVRKTPFWDIFQNDFWGTKLSHKQSHKSYRPFTILSFRGAVQYKCTPCPDEVNGKVHKTGISNR